MIAADQQTGHRTISVPIVIAAVIAAADDIAYVLIIRSQGDFQDDPGRVIFVAGYLAAAAVLALSAALVSRTEIRLWLLGGATGALFGLGVLGAFSIGLPLLVAGALTAVAWIKSTEPGQPTSVKALPWVLALVGVGVLIAGIALT